MGMVDQIYEGLLRLIKSLPIAHVNNVCSLRCVFFFPPLGQTGDSFHNANSYSMSLSPE